MSLAKNIRFLRKSRNWSQDDLAYKLGYKSFTTIQKWESGISEPPFKQISKMAELFNISMQDLTTSDLATGNVKNLNGGVRIPVLGKVAAGIPIEAVEDIIDWEEVPESMAAAGELFALQIKGDSMQPKIDNGDVVIVRRQETIESGEIAVVLVNGNDATVKKIKIDEGGMMLIASNPAYEPIYYTNKQVHELPVTILGKVIELRAKF